MMTVEEKPDVTYNDVGGCKEQIEKMREVCPLYIFFCIVVYSEIFFPFLLLALTFGMDVHLLAHT